MRFCLFLHQDSNSPHKNLFDPELRDIFTLALVTLRFVTDATSSSSAVKNKDSINYETFSLLMEKKANPCRVRSKRDRQLETDQK